MGSKNIFLCNEYLAKFAHKNAVLPITKVVLKNELSEKNLHLAKLT
jgi:hypothetical protein